MSQKVYLTILRNEIIDVCSFDWKHANVWLVSHISVRLAVSELNSRPLARENPVSVRETTLGWICLGTRLTCDFTR